MSIKGPRYSAATVEDAEIIDFRGRADLNFDWQLTPDIRIHSELGLAGSGNDDVDDVAELQQAFVDWQFSDLWGIRAGRFEQWIGWERLDAPDLWRINETYTFYNTGSVNGDAALFI